jgi:hypothetical protein
MTRLLRFLQAVGVVTVAAVAGYLAGCWVREVRRARADAARWQATRV